MFGRRRLNAKNHEKNRQKNIARTNRKEKKREKEKNRKESFVSELVDLSLKEMNEMAEVADASGQFRNLLMDQLTRVMDMQSNQKPPKNFGEMSKIVIGLCPGDGIGPIIMEQAVRLLKAVLASEIESGRIELKPIEGLTIENRLAKMEAVPSDVLEEIKQCDVLLKGPTTTPKGGNLESANVALRRELDLYANVRPVSVPSEGIDWTFFRENTEGEYVLGSKGIEIPGKLSFDFKVTTEPGTRRIARKAFEYARANGKTKMAIVTKANIMKKTDGNFSRICHEIGLEYPEVEMEDWYIDIMTAKLVDEKRRNQFQVIVLPNLYGDILTDEAAELQGGVGTAGSANIGNHYAMFEAIHGSAPRMVQEGRDKYADPCSVIRAGAMLLSHIGYQEEADKLNRAIDACAEEKKLVLTGRSDGATGAEYADYILSKI